MYSFPFEFISNLSCVLFFIFYNSESRGFDLEEEDDEDDDLVHNNDFTLVRTLYQLDLMAGRVMSCRGHVGMV